LRVTIAGQLVARGFAVAAAVVVAAEKFVGFGADGDEFAVAPDAGVVFVGLSTVLMMSLLFSTNG
jgi:hypothetical protein